MNYNPTAQTTHWFVENQMMLIQNHSWNPNGSNGKGDSIGRTKDAYFCYNDPQFIEGIKRCWTKHYDIKRDKYYYGGQRYPSEEYTNKSFSRDHTFNTFAALRLANDPFIKELANNICWVINEKHISIDGKKINKHSFTPSLWGWIKQFGGKWWGAPLFYFVSFLELILYLLQNGLIYLIAGFSREYSQNDYHAKTMANQKQSKWKQFWRNKTYPIYALEHFGWQLYLMNDNPIKRLLQFMIYPLIPRHNHFLKLLFNVGKVTEKQVLEYKSMKGGRWKTVLNEINDRDVFIIEDEKWLYANVLDVDLLIKMWNIRHEK